MNSRILLPLAAVAAAAALLLAGCATTDPKPTHSSSHTVTPTPTPTVGDMAPPQDPVDPPASADEAKAAAVKTINAYLHYDFQLLAHPELGGNYLFNYVAGNAMTIADNTAKSGVSNKDIAVGGPVVFTPNYGASTTGQTIGASDGKTYPNAVAYMVGCADNSALKFSTNGAAPTPVSTKTTGADEFTVQWNEKGRVWLVMDVRDITGQPGAPTC